jgi:hypothetical protein
MADDKTKNKDYLAKDFNSFRSDLTNFARNYFIDQNADFSEASLGGMFVELAAYVGDSMSYFLDYQFNELDPLLAVETENILSHARNAGLKIHGASPASCTATLYVEVPSTTVNGEYVPDDKACPVILEGTTINTTAAVPFTTTEDIDFAQKNFDGTLMAKIRTSGVDGSGNPTNFILTRDVGAVSGNLYSQSFTLGAPSPFRKITIAQANVSEIISVKDADGNVYYEVDYLSQNTAFKKTKNLSYDDIEVPSMLQVVSAARRFIRSTNYATAITTLTFGSGDETQPDNDLIPDPSELALPLYGKKTFSRFSIDPKNMLKTSTLGVAPANTTLTIVYRAGGGLSHNVDAGSFSGFTNLRVTFPRSPSAVASTSVFNSIDVTNAAPATGGLPKPTFDDIKNLTFQSRNQQSRIVSQDDLLARIYSMPSTFGRVYRASVRKSSRNPLATELYVLCQNKMGELTIASDTLKKNLSTYLNQFRLITDAIDVLDATIINYGIEYSIVVTPDTNKQTVLSAVSRSIQQISAIRNYQLDQPVIEADFINAIINTNGVLSLQEVVFFNKSGSSYSNYAFDLQSNMYKGMVVGPPGSVFELKNPGINIIGRAE